MPAPLPSPRVSDAPRSSSGTPEPTARDSEPEPTARLPIPDRGSPNELSIHIEAEEDEEDEDESPLSPEDEVRETVLTVPTRNPKRGTDSTTTTQSSSKGLQIQSLQVKPLQVRTLRASNTSPGSQRSSRSSDKEVILGHKTSLRDRVSMQGSVPKAIHVPPVNAHEFHRPPNNNTNNTTQQTAQYTQHRYQSPIGSPQSQQPPQSSRGPEMQRHPEAVRRHHTQQPDGFTPPTFPSLLPSPASERQHFRPVQASPHSPLQQRPHTAGTVRPSAGRLAAPSQMGMSTLSRVMTTNTTTTTGTGADRDSTRTAVKKKRSAFGWLKKAFSLDEEERAMFEARKRAMPVNYYQPFYGSPDGQSPRYLDGKRIG